MTAALEKSRPPVTDALAVAEGRLLVPFRSAFTLPAGCRREVYEAGFYIVDAAARVEGLGPGARQHARERAGFVLDQLPPRQQLEALASAAADAVAEPPDRNRARALIGLLLDSFPSGRPPDLRRYADALLFDVMDLEFSPAVIAKGCQIVRRTSEFLPTSAKLIAACEQARGELQGIAKSQQRLAEFSGSAERLLKGIPHLSVGASESGG